MDYGRSVGRGILGTDRVDARSRAPAHSESIDAAAGELQQAIGELRDIARDCTPWSSGMPDWPLPFGRSPNPDTCESPKTPADRYSDVVESTADMPVAHSSEAGPSTVPARADQSTLVVDVEIDGRPELLGEIAYRITTLVEGSLTSDFRNGRTRRTLMRPL